MSTAEERETAGLREGGAERASHADELENYAGGFLQSRHGYIPAWLLAVYTVLFVWAFYYVYVYWGSLGPGLAN